MMLRCYNLLYCRNCLAIQVAVITLTMKIICYSKLRIFNDLMKWFRFDQLLEYMFLYFCLFQPAIAQTPICNASGKRQPASQHATTRRPTRPAIYHRHTTLAFANPDTFYSTDIAFDRRTVVVSIETELRDRSVVILSRPSPPRPRRDYYTTPSGSKQGPILMWQNHSLCI